MADRGENPIDCPQTPGTPQESVPWNGTTRQGSAVGQDSLQERLPSGSVYRWAAKLDGACASDVMVGWIVLLIQISSYAILLAKAGKRDFEDLLQATIVYTVKSSNTDDQYDDLYTNRAENYAEYGSYDYTLEASYGQPVSYAVSSIAVAVFLVLTFAGADLRGSWALLQTGLRYNVALGLAILSSFVLLVMASISALFFLANDDVSFIVGAAAVLFISDLDEKLWAVLKTVSGSYRLFWVAEAVFLSLAIAIMGIIWMGETTATSPAGITAASSDDQSRTYYSDFEFSIEQAKKEVFLALLYNWFFACIIAPIGATVLAWEVAFMLQSGANRYDSREATGNANLSQFFFLEAFFLMNLAYMLVVQFIFYQWFVSFDLVSLYGGLVFSSVRLLVTAALAALGAVCMCLPCLEGYISRGSCKVLIGLGVGKALFVSASLLVAFISSTLSASLSITVAVVVTLASVVLMVGMLALGVAITETFESFPAKFRVVAWRWRRARGGLSPSTDGVGDSPAIVGSTTVALGLYVRMYMLEVLIYAIRFGVLKI